MKKLGTHYLRPSLDLIYTDPDHFTLLHLSIVQDGHKDNKHKSFLYVNKQSTNG